MIRLINFLFLLILSIPDFSVHAVREETFFEHLNKMDIPDKFQLEEVTIGNENAKTHLIVYSSFTCPHCREFHTNVLPEFKKKYVDTGKVKISFRCYLDDQGALEAAQIVRCLCRPLDEYMRLYHKVYEKQVEWLKSKQPHDYLVGIFVNLGFPEKKVKACLKKSDIGAGLMLEQKRAMREFGLFSMPAFLVNGEVRHVGYITYDQLVNICGL